MVEILLYIEGGVLPTPNIPQHALSNSESLRESFHKLFSQHLDSGSFRLKVEMSGPDRQAAKFFKSELKKGKNACLVIDLEGPQETIAERYERLEIQETDRLKVCFMIQKMEAWILSQPDKIEATYSHLTRNKPDQYLAADTSIKDKHPEAIHNPDKVLHTLLGRYFQEERRGKTKKKKYNKLKDGATLLSQLDLNRLKNKFHQLNLFLQSITTH